MMVDPSKQLNTAGRPANTAAAASDDSKVSVMFLSTTHVGKKQFCGYSVAFFSFLFCWRLCFCDFNGL